MKRKIMTLLMVISLCFVTTGCNKNNNEDNKLSIVSTVYPMYDFVNQIIGDDSEAINTTLLLDNGNDMHSYEPSLEDTTKILEANIFIYIGGESDSWVSDVLDKNKDDSLIVINVMDLLKERLLEEEIKEGMEGHEDHEHEHDHEHEEIELDEHVWLSLKNASLICSEIYSALDKIDSSNKDLYKQNLDTYLDKLEQLDNEYKTMVSNASKNCILFADRFPFRYMVNDYNIDYFAAFVGCSSATEASTQTIAFLVDKVVELKLNVILVIDGSDQTIANTIKKDALKKDSTQDIEILTIDSLQAVNMKSVEDDFSYLKVMKQNLEVLKKTLA